MEPLVILEKFYETNVITCIEEIHSFRIYDRLSKSVQNMPYNKVKELLKQHGELFFNATYRGAGVIIIDGGNKIPATNVITGAKKNVRSLIALRRVENGIVVLKYTGTEKVLFDIDKDEFKYIINLKDGLRMFSGKPLDFDGTPIKLDSRQSEALRTEAINSIVNANKPWNLDSKLKLTIHGAKEPYDIVLNRVSSIKRNDGSARYCRRFIVKGGLRSIPEHMFYHGLLEQFEAGPDLREIKEGAFGRLEKLRVLDLRKYKKLTKIGPEAFVGSCIDELYFPDNLEEYNDFSDNIGVRVLGLPRNVGRIRELDFSASYVETLIFPEAAINMAELKRIDVGSRLREIYTWKSNIELAKWIQSVRNNIQIRLIS